MSLGSSCRRIRVMLCGAVVVILALLLMGASPREEDAWIERLTVGRQAGVRLDATSPYLADGDIIEARFEILEGDAPMIVLGPGLSFDPEIEGETEGAFRFTVRVTQPQTVTLRLILVDAAGLESEPYEFTFDVE